MSPRRLGWVDFGDGDAAEGGRSLPLLSIVEAWVGKGVPPPSCPNTTNDGYVEVCKQSNPSFPVSGTFNFTVTAPQFSSGPVSVPVGKCSGAIQVPSGTVAISESQQTGVSVSDVNAYSYSPGYTNELVAWPAPNPTNPYAAEVNIQPGNDVALETIATFTNASQGGRPGN
ncbi:MAG: hypothetical protein WA213_12520 [Terriglobales bacterium]